jgi:hypothetical protein
MLQTDGFRDEVIRGGELAADVPLEHVRVRSDQIISRNSAPYPCPSKVRKNDDVGSCPVMTMINDWLVLITKLTSRHGASMALTGKLMGGWGAMSGRCWHKNRDILDGISSLLKSHPLALLYDSRTLLPLSRPIPPFLGA